MIAKDHKEYQEAIERMNNKEDIPLLDYLKYLKNR